MLDKSNYKIKNNIFIFLAFFSKNLFLKYMREKFFVNNIGNLLDSQHISYYKFLLEGISEEINNLKIDKPKGLLTEDKRKDSRYRVYFLTNKIKFRLPEKNFLEIKKEKGTYFIEAFVPIFCSIKKKDLAQEHIAKKKNEKAIYYSDNIYLCKIPLLTQEGSFIVSGCERVVVSQIIRSPGVYFQKRTHFLSKEVTTLTTIISDKGVWTRIEDITIDCESFFLNKNLNNEEKEPTLINITDFFKYFGISEKEVSLFLNKKQTRKLLELTNNIDKKENYIKLAGTLKKIFNKKLYGVKGGCLSIGAEGRLKLNNKFGYNAPLYSKYVSALDFIYILKSILDIKYFGAEPDDIDHLKNKKIRPVGGLLQKQFREDNLLALRLAYLTSKQNKTKIKIIKEGKYHLKNLEYAGSETVSNGFFSFFRQSPLSQYMDQTNSLAEITHKRRLTFFGPNGINRNNAGTGIRNIHPSQYGKICPVETPEGETAGLVSSFSLFSKFNSQGGLEIPCYKVVNGIVDKNQTPIYLSSDFESKVQLGFPDISINNSNSQISQSSVAIKKDTFFSNIKKEDVKLVTISPLQLLSFAISLVPFVEHNDANRGLMGANMQRQAVPLLYLQKPIVGTSFESLVPLDSEMVTISYTKGFISASLSNKIIAKDLKGQELHYHLKKYWCSNQGTSINQQACVWEGEKIFSGQIIADGGGSLDGEFSIGKNLTVAYMPWDGYNFEDAIIISENLVSKDILTSVQLEEYESLISTNFFESEDIDFEDKASTTLPFVKEKNKGFGYAFLQLLNLALRNRKYDSATKTSINEGALTTKDCLKAVKKLFRLNKNKNAEESFDNIAKDIFQLIKNEKKKIAKKSKVSKPFSKRIYESPGEIYEGVLHLSENESANLDEFGIIKKGYCAFPGDILHSKFSIRDREIATNEQIFLESLGIESGLSKYNDESFRLPEGARVRVLDICKLYGEAFENGKEEKLKFVVAQIKRIEVGDKLAGRHGNKGVISKIAAVQDMPYLPDGTPVDIILNPLGVPSRMNIGQVFESLLGFAGYYLGKRFKVVPFDELFGPEASRILVNQKLKEAKSFSCNKWIYSKESPGKILLKDGRSGETFDNPIFVGKSYIIKLIHMVENKIQARSVGSYSMITEQPTAGRSQGGGQRFGEMEVWALESFGCSSVLSELLTVKSDDIRARNEAYESVVFDKNIKSSESFIGETFLALIRELNALGIDLSLKKVEVSLPDAESFEPRTIDIFNVIEKSLRLKSLIKYERESSAVKEALNTENLDEDRHMEESKIFLEACLRNSLSFY